VDGLGKIIRWERAGKDHVLDIAAPAEVMRYLVFKGSVAGGRHQPHGGERAEEKFPHLDHPHTFDVTVLRERKVGDAVNLEADLLGKYVEKFLAARRK